MAGKPEWRGAVAPGAGKQQAHLAGNQRFGARERQSRADQPRSQE
jgi:hypothetical protein